MRLDNMNKKTVLILVTILLIASLLRFYGLDKESLWLDEGTTALSMKYHGPYETLKIFFLYGQILPEFYTNKPDLPTANADLPVYYFFLAVWTKFFGTSAVSLRAFSALFGSLSILLIFLIAKEIFNDKVALVSSLIASLNLTLIEYSQEARNYSFLLFFSLLSIYYFVMFLKSNKNKYLALFIIFTIVAVYTHFLFVFLVFFQALYIYSKEAINIFKNKKLRLSKLSLYYIIIPFSYLPLIARILRQKLSTVPHFGEISVQNLLKLAIRFNSWLYPSNHLRDLIYQKNFMVFSSIDILLVCSVILTALILIVFALRYTFSSMKKIKKKYTFDDPFVILWLIVPVTLPFFMTLLRPTIRVFGQINYLIYTLPAYFIIVSKGILGIRWKYGKIVIILFILLSILPIYAYYSNTKKQQFREAAFYLKENVKNDEAIFFNIRNGIVPFTYYYGKSEQAFPLPNLSRAMEISKEKKSIWLVYTFAKYSDPDGTIKKYFDETYNLAESKHFFDVELYHYIKN